MYVDTGETTQNGPFEHYEASPEVIEASAVELDRSYGNVEALSADVDATHRPALTGISGALTGPMAQAPTPQRRNARTVMGAAMVAAGSVRIFGFAVERFNQGVDALNERWRQATESDFGVAPATYPPDANAAQISQIDAAREDQTLLEKIALFAELSNDYRMLHVKLDEDARKSAAQLESGPTDQVILNLYAAGGLPSTVVHAFPHLQFEAGKLPPDLANLSEFEIEDYLLAHPDIADAVVNPLLAKDDLTDQEQAIVEAQARLDADVLKHAMTMPPGADALEEIDAALARLKLINAHVAKTGELNDAAHSYTFAYLNEVGSEDLAKLPSVVRESVGETVTSVHQDIDAMVKSYLTPVGDAILNLSNEQLQETVLPEGQGTTYRYDFNSDGVIDKDDLPKAVRELDATTNLDAFGGYADLLSSSTVEGGIDYSKHLTIEVMQLSDAFDDADGDEYTDLENRLTAVFDVTSRNHEAMHDLITGENMGGFEGVKVDPSSNRFEAYDPRDFLYRVYTTEWADNGANAAELVDWMGEVHADEHASGYDKQLADDAFRSWFDTMTGTGDQGPSAELPKDGLFDYLMEHADASPGADEQSFGEMNPELANSLSRTTVNYLDWLSGASEDPHPKDSAADRASDGVMDNAEKVRLMMLGVTTDDSAQILGVGIAGFQQGNGLHVEPGGDTDHASAAGAENARLQAYYDAALHNEAMTRTDNEQEAANDEAERKQAVIDFLKGAAGGIPVGNNPLAAIAKGAFVAGAGATLEVKPEDVPLLPPNAETTNTDPSSFKYESTYNLLQTQVANGTVKPSDLPSNLVDDATGKLRPIEDIEIRQPGVGGDEAPKMDDVRGQMEKALSVNGVDARAYTTDLWDTFDSLRDQYALREEDIADFNERGEVPPA